MVSKVSYRPFTKDDFDDIVAIVRDAWHADAPSERYGLLEATCDLAHYLSISTFSQVSLIDGKPRGVVLARSDGDRVAEGDTWKRISEHAFRRMKASEPQRADAYWRYFSSMMDLNSKMLEESELSPANEVTMLAVSEEARGMGIGSVLFDAALSYLSSRGAQQAIIYTDTDCSWPFYEQRGLKRAGQHRSTREERKQLPKELYLYGLDLSA